MLEKLGFAELVQEMITSSRETRVMSLYQFVLGIVLGLYIGFPRLNHLRFIAEDPIVTGIVKVQRLPPQSTLWRFMAALHLNVEKQILSIQKTLRERAWQAANVQLNGVTLDTDTTVHTRLRSTDGSPQGVQPEEQREEELSTDADVHRGNAGVFMGRLAQRRSSERPGDWRSHPAGGGGTAIERAEDFRPSRCRILLRRSGGRL